MRMKTALGLDVGGTQIKAGLVTQTGQLLARWITPTGEGGPALLSRLVSLIGQVQIETPSDRQPVGIGIGVPGPVTEGRVHGCVNLVWGEVAVEEKLRQATGLPVRAQNDADVAALGEWWVGEGRQCTSFLFVTVGTGVGSGLVQQGRVWTGAHGAAGEIGHFTVRPEETAVCTCGNRGGLEQYASASALLDWANRFGGTYASAQEVMQGAKSGEISAQQALAQMTDTLGIALAAMANGVDPERIVLGGGVSQAGEFWRAKVAQAFVAHAFGPVKQTPIRLSQLKNDAGMLGAAKLILDEI